MSLFLKNLPRSFYRSVVSSRPVFDKANSLFHSIAANANRSPPVTQSSVYDVGNHHARSICFRNVERKPSLKKYSLPTVRYYARKRRTDREANKPSSAEVKKAASKTSKKGSTGNVKSDAVSCKVEKGIMQCTVDCNKLGGNKPMKGDKPPTSPPTPLKGGVGKKSSPTKETKTCKTKEEKKCKSSKSDPGPTSTHKPQISRPCKKKDDGLVRMASVDLKDLTGTWVSKKCIKYDFSCPGGIAEKEGTRPVRIEDGGTLSSVAEQNAMLQIIGQCKKSPSKVNMSTRTGKEEDEPCGVQKSKDCVSVSVTVTVEDKGASPTVCVATKKKKKHKDRSSGYSSKSKKHGKKLARKTKGAHGVDGKPCKPCVSKKPAADEKSASRSKDRAGAAEAKPDRQSESRSGKPTELSSSRSEADAAQKAGRSTTALRKSRSGTSPGREPGERESRPKREGSGECQPSPKLDSKLPKPKKQEKDLIRGSKSFIKSVCDGIKGGEGKGSEKKVKASKSKQKTHEEDKKDEHEKQAKAARKGECHEEHKKDEHGKQAKGERKDEHHEEDVAREEGECEHEGSVKESGGKGQRLKAPCEFEHKETEGAKDCKKFPFPGCSDQEKSSGKEAKEKMSKSKISEKKKKSAKTDKRSKEGAKVTKKKSEKKMVCTDDPDRDPHAKKSEKKATHASKKGSKKGTKTKKKKSESRGRSSSAGKISKGKSEVDHVCSEACIEKCPGKKSGVEKKRSASAGSTKRSKSKSETQLSKRSSSKTIEPCKKEDADRPKSSGSGKKLKQRSSSKDSKKERSRSASRSAKCKKSRSTSARGSVKKSKSAHKASDTPSRSGVAYDECLEECVKECQSQGGSTMARKGSKSKMSKSEVQKSKSKLAMSARKSRSTSKTKMSKKSSSKMIEPCKKEDADRPKRSSSDKKLEQKRSSRAMSKSKMSKKSSSEMTESHEEEEADRPRRSGSEKKLKQKGSSKEMSKKSSSRMTPCEQKSADRLKRSKSDKKLRERSSSKESSKSKMAKKSSSKTGQCRKENTDKPKSSCSEHQIKQRGSSKDIKKVRSRSARHGDKSSISGTAHDHAKGSKTEADEDDGKESRQTKSTSDCANNYSKEELIKMLEECRKQRDELKKMQWTGEKKYSGPPDQSPIMQCIALCKKKRKANEPQKGKGVPPRDKKPISEDKQIFKKLVEYNEGSSSSKQDIKQFIPCKHEEIKPGIRSEGGEAKKSKSGEDCKSKKDKKGSSSKEIKSSSSKEMKSKKDHKEPAEKKSSKQLSEEKRSWSSSVVAGKTCPKLKNPCKDSAKESSEEAKAAQDAIVVCVCPDGEAETLGEEGKTKSGEHEEERCGGRNEEGSGGRNKERGGGHKEDRSGGCGEEDNEHEVERLGRKEDPCNKEKKSKRRSDVNPCEEEKAKMRAKRKEKCEKESKERHSDEECHTIEDKCAKKREKDECE